MQADTEFFSIHSQLYQWFSAHSSHYLSDLLYSSDNQFEVVCIFWQSLEVLSKEILCSTAEVSDCSFCIINIGYLNHRVFQKSLSLESTPSKSLFDVKMWDYYETTNIHFLSFGCMIGVEASQTADTWSWFKRSSCILRLRRNKHHDIELSFYESILFLLKTWVHVLILWRAWAYTHEEEVQHFAAVTERCMYNQNKAEFLLNR